MSVPTDSSSNNTQYQKEKSFTVQTSVMMKNSLAIALANLILDSNTENKALLALAYEILGPDYKETR